MKPSPLVRRTPLRSRGGSRKTPRHNDNPAKRAWIRQHPCDQANHLGHQCVGVTQCCHEKHGWHQDDRFCLPGCAQFHTEDHSGRKTLEKKLDFNFHARCLAYDRAWEQQQWANEPKPAA